MKSFNLASSVTSLLLPPRSMASSSATSNIEYWILTRDFRRILMGKLACTERWEVDLGAVIANSHSAKESTKHPECLSKYWLRAPYADGANAGSVHDMGLLEPQATGNMGP